MLSFLHTALESKRALPDKLIYLTSVQQLQTIRTDESQTEYVINNINNLIASSETRIQGLLFLDVAIEQNPEICFKQKWDTLLAEIFKETGSYVAKEKACKVLNKIVCLMAKDPSGSSDFIPKYLAFIPNLLDKNRNSEWIIPAVHCLATCLKCFPSNCRPHKDDILMFILHHADTASSVMFQALAECYSELPNCTNVKDSKTYENIWSNYYLSALNTLHSILNNAYEPTTVDDTNKNVLLPNVQLLPLDITSSTDVFSAYMKYVRLFVNISKCLAAMLNLQVKYPVAVPVNDTTDCISRVFQLGGLRKLPSASTEDKLLLSTIYQMQIASLVLLEPLLRNLNVKPDSLVVRHILHKALQESAMDCVFPENIYPLRHTAWRMFVVWIAHEQSKASFSIMDEPEILKELLKDVIVEDALKPDPNTLNIGRKNGLTNSSKETTCEEALKVLELLLYSSIPHFTEKIRSELLEQCVHIAYAIHLWPECPFPYNNERCRKKFYDVIIALSLISKPSELDPIQTAVSIISNVSKDASTMVACARLKAACLNRLVLHPKKPPPLLNRPEAIKKEHSSEDVKFREWSPLLDTAYVPNIPAVENVSNASENITPRVAQAYHPTNKEMHSGEYMQVDMHYPDLSAEGQCNGDEMLDIQNSSQDQDDESDDEDDDEDADDDDDDDDRSYSGNDNLELQSGRTYISSEIQVINPVHINADIARQNSSEQEFQELKPCDTTTSVNAIDSNNSNNKNLQLNGKFVTSSAPEEEVHATYMQNITNENGIYNSDDEPVEDEEEDEEELAHIAEKKAPPEFYETPHKRPKLEVDEVNNEDKIEDIDQVSNSPTLAEMKSDFVFNEVDIKS